MAVWQPQQFGSRPLSSVMAFCHLGRRHFGRVGPVDGPALAASAGGQRSARYPAGGRFVRSYSETTHQCAAPPGRPWERPRDRPWAGLDDPVLPLGPCGHRFCWCSSGDLRWGLGRELGTCPGCGNSDRLFKIRCRCALAARCRHGSRVGMGGCLDRYRLDPAGRRDIRALAASVWSGDCRTLLAWHRHAADRVAQSLRRRFEALQGLMPVCISALTIRGPYFVDERLR